VATTGAGALLGRVVVGDDVVGDVDGERVEVGESVWGADVGRCVGKRVGRDVGCFVFLAFFFFFLDGE